MVYSVSLWNIFIKQNSVNTEAVFMMNKLFSPFVGMDFSNEMTAAALLGCTHKPRSCQPCYHLRKKFWVSVKLLLNALASFNKILLLLLGA
jgi:predicted DNA-binding protein (MmcQ/YjbR family)